MSKRSCIKEPAFFEARGSFSKSIFDSPTALGLCEKIGALYFVIGKVAPGGHVFLTFQPFFFTISSSSHAVCQNAFIVKFVLD